MELVDMRVLGTRAFGVSVRVRPGAIIKLRVLLASLHLRCRFARARHRRCCLVLFIKGRASRKVSLRVRSDTFRDTREVRDREKRKKIKGEIRK